MKKTENYKAYREVNTFDECFELMFQKADDNTIVVYMKTLDSDEYKEIESYEGDFDNEYTEEQNIERAASAYMDNLLDCFSEDFLVGVRDGDN